MDYGFTGNVFKALIIVLASIFIFSAFHASAYGVSPSAEASQSQNSIVETYHANSSRLDQAAEAKLAENYTDHGTDVNDDKLYDFLTVDIGIFVQTPGEYSLMGFLYDHNDSEVVWSISRGDFKSGYHVIPLDFDGKTIEKHGWNGTYYLKKVILSSGSSPTGLSICDYAPDPYATSSYNSTDFVDPIRTEKVITGVGSGELSLTFTIRDTTPVYSGRYSYDIVGINIPPIATSFNVTGSNYPVMGYAYDMPGVYIPIKPNNFTVSAEGVKNLNIGLKKPQDERIRTWISTQVEATEDGSASTESDLLSPGSYHVKIFGDAAENVSNVDLIMMAEKKIIVNGSFDLSMDTSGFPSGSYAITAKAINGSFSFDEIVIDGLTITD